MTETDPKTLAELLSAFIQAEDAGGGRMAKPLARTAWGYLARGLANEPIDPTRRIKLEKLEETLGAVPVFGFLAGDPELKGVTATIKAQAMKCGVTSPDTINSYTHAGRRPFLWAIAHGLPLLEKPSEQDLSDRTSTLPIRRTNPPADAAVTKKMLRLRYYYHVRDWPEGPRQSFEGFITWATGPASRKRHRRNKQRPVTAKGYEERMSSYFGYLRNVAKLLWLPNEEPIEGGMEFTSEAFFEALQSYAYLASYRDWAIRTHMEIRGVPDYVPPTVRKTLMNAAVIVRRYWYPVVRNESIEADDVAAVVALGELGALDDGPALKDGNSKLPGIPDILGVADDLDRLADAQSAPLTRASMKRFALILRLSMFLPLRERVWLAMRYGFTIARDRDGWHIHLAPSLLKTRQRVVVDLPACLDCHLDAYVAPGGPRDVILKARPRRRRTGGEVEPDQSLMFPSEGGMPLSASGLYHALRAWMWTLRRIRLSVHMLRDVVATYHLSPLTGDPREVLMTAHLLGDRLETVVARYLHADVAASVLRAADAVSKAMPNGRDVGIAEQFKALSDRIGLSTEQRDAILTLIAGLHQGNADLRADPGMPRDKTSP